jgi:cation:H+ antiporter
MWVAVLLLIVGFALTVFGANWLVDGAASLAKKLNISNLVIGLTVVAFGTSMPEFVVSFISALNNKTDIAVGNVVGSNIFNILFILGISAFLYPISVQRSTIWKEIPYSLLAAVVLLFLANDVILDNETQGWVSRIDGLVLLSFFAIFLYYSTEISKNVSDSENEVKEFTILKSIFLLIVGLVGLIFGGRFMVNSAVDIARVLGISEAIIGLTIVSIGTSVPELATSIVAAMKKNSDIAIGNVVGSNIFNIFFILGISATISPLSFNPVMNFDLVVCALTSGLLFLFMFVGHKGKLMKMEGLLFMLLYVAYVGYLIYQEGAR